MRGAGATQPYDENANSRLDLFLALPNAFADPPERRNRG